MRKNTTRSAELSLNEGGNYSCVATSYYGTNIRIIPVFIIGKAIFCYLLSLATNLPIIPKNAAFWDAILDHDWQLGRVGSFKCLQVRASHYSGILSPSFIFSWTTIANISASFKCIVSYCCLKMKLGDNAPWIMRDGSCLLTPSFRQN